MSTKEMAERLDRLEDQDRQQSWTWLKSLPLEEVEAELARRPPDPEFEAAVRWLSRDDLKRACEGKLSPATIRQLYRRAQSQPVGRPETDGLDEV